MITEEYTIKYKEFDKENNRDGCVVRTVTRAASSDKEARNKIAIAFPRCRIVACTPKIGR